jgi:putative transcriptional regulator
MRATGNWRILAVLWTVCVAASLLFAVSPRAAAPAAPTEPGGSLAGRLLVAAPSMVDPRFRNAVIYICVHDSEGAFGIVINRELGAVAARRLADEFGLGPISSDAPVHLLWGGPVELGRGFVLHSTDYLKEGSLKVTDDIALTNDPDTLTDLLAGRGPAEALFAVGYAGWGPNQLEAELARQDWFTIDAGKEFVFRQDRAAMWRAALDLRAIDL